MPENQFGRLLAGLWSDTHEPAILWQVGALALCLAAAWWFSRLLQWRAPDSSTEALKRGAAAFRRVIFPLLAMLLLVAGRAILRNWYNTNLLSVAIPLFAAPPSFHCCSGIPQCSRLANPGSNREHKPHSRNRLD